MIETPCMCGAPLVGADVDEQVDVAVEHFADAHSSSGLTQVSIRNYLESVQRVDGPTERLEEIGEIVVKPVSPDTRADVIEFFDKRAFADNPGWGMCFCMYHHVSGTYSTDWSKRPWQLNRDEMSERIDAGTTTGVVAYVDGVLAGWCNATARSQFPAKTDGDDANVGSIACFAVAPPYRGHGIQRRLLAAAEERLAELGFEIAEAYPVREVRRPGDAFVGLLSLYEERGYEVVSEEPLVVRKSLG